MPLMSSKVPCKVVRGAIVLRVKQLLCKVLEASEVRKTGTPFFP